GAVATVAAAAVAGAVALAVAGRRHAGDGQAGPRHPHLAVLAFAAPTCEGCEELRAAVARLRRRHPDLAVDVVELSDRTHATFLAFGVSATPSVVVVGADGQERARGTARSVGELEALLGAAAPPGERPSP
ncbi:MAG: TlpA family protein disulfide reductase, partial [Acidimicrobiales bacterium]